MPVPQYQSLIEQIHATGTPLVVAATGGGSGAIAALLAVPGASVTVLEAVVPYAQRALAEWLGGPVDQACSERTARAMAMASFERARTLSDAPPCSLRGVGVAASLATTRAKRGAHRIHVAWQSAERTVALTCELTKGARTRDEEEQLATRLALAAVADACDIDPGPIEGLENDEQVTRREKRAAKEWTELLLGQRWAVAVDNENKARPSAPAVLFPGAFAPLHAGHVQMARIAEGRSGSAVTWELSIVNVDKPPLDFLEIDDRLAGLAGREVLVTRAATFVEKARLAPGATILVGVDTLARIAEPRYYGGEPQRDEAIAQIADQGCRFLVFGRRRGEGFATLADLDLPPELRLLCDEVPESEFHEEVSSTDLRRDGM